MSPVLPWRFYLRWKSHLSGHWLKGKPSNTLNERGDERHNIWLRPRPAVPFACNFSLINATSGEISELSSFPLIWLVMISCSGFAVYFLITQFKYKSALVVSG